MNIQLYTKYLFEDIVEQFPCIFKIHRKIFLRRISFLKKHNAQSLEHNIPYFDPDSIAMDEDFENFIVDFLHQLEPIQFTEGEVIQR